MDFPWPIFKNNFDLITFRLIFEIKWNLSQKWQKRLGEDLDFKDKEWYRRKCGSEYKFHVLECPKMFKNSTDLILN